MLNASITDLVLVLKTPTTVPAACHASPPPPPLPSPARPGRPIMPLAVCFFVPTGPLHFLWPQRSAPGSGV